MTPLHRYLLLVLAATLAGLLGGCATTGGEAPTRQDVVPWKHGLLAQAGLRLPSPAAGEAPRSRG